MAGCRGHVPTTVRLAEAECSVGCCGCIDIQVRRDGGHIIWDQWCNPDGGDLPFAEFRFDTEQ